MDELCSHLEVGIFTPSLEVVLFFQNRGRDTDLGRVRVKNLGVQGGLRGRTRARQDVGGGGGATEKYTNSKMGEDMGGKEIEIEEIERGIFLLKSSKLRQPRTKQKSE